MNKYHIIQILITIAILFHNCNEVEETAIYTTEITSQTTELAGSMTGTLHAGGTYRVTADLIIPPNGEIVLEEGVTLLIDVPELAPQIRIINHGTFISRGTIANPNRITVAENLQHQRHQSTQLWGGIQCSEKAKNITIKWTKIEHGAGNTNAKNAPEGRLVNGIWAQNDDTKIIIKHSEIF